MAEALHTNLQEVLADRDFWSWYLREGEDHDSSLLASRYGESIRIQMPCTEGYRLVLDLAFSFYAAELSLLELTTNSTHSLGWWDDARWHPHCLRWAELVSLGQHLRHARPVSVNPHYAIVLLSAFVGIGTSELPAYPEYLAELRQHVLKIPPFLGGISDRLLKHALPLPTEDDYDWSHDRDLGWLFTGDYPCYSLRNREHMSGDEGAFPFTLWERIINTLDRTPPAP